MRPRKWQVFTAAGAVTAVILTGTGWVGLRAKQASGHVERARALFATFEQRAEAGDLDQARDVLASLQSELRAARDELSGPAWAVAGKAPYAGDDATAVRTVVSALDDLATRALPGLLEVASGVERAVVTQQGGRVDLTAFRSATAAVDTARAVIEAGRRDVSAIRLDRLVPRVRAGVAEAVHGFERAAALTRSGSLAAALIPPMLGASGPRTYLVLFQNLAEARASGGIPGAYIVVEANAGAVRIVDQGTAASDLKVFPTPVLPLDPDMVALHTERLGTFPANINLTPDFPTTARLAREMYRLRSGRTVDGVMATDPIALAYLLAATGPVTVPGGAPLTAETAARRLLSDPYRTMSDKQQDAFFAGAARAIFDALVGHGADPRKLLSTLARAAGERRLLIWSADPDEQQRLAGTMFGGTLPRDEASTPTVGVFLNDGSGAKLSYYLTHSADVAVANCAPDGSAELKLTVTLGSTAPASGLPRGVLGLGLSGDPYTVRTDVLVYAPTGGGISAATVDGADARMATGVELRRQVAALTVDLPPGVTKTLGFTLLTAPLGDTATATTPRLVTTPGVTAWPTRITPGPGCA